MEQRILLNLGQGDWHTGFATVTAQLWEDNRPPIQFTGSLPPMPQLAIHYEQWQQLYTAIYGSQSPGWRGASDFEFATTDPTNVSQQTFDTLCSRLKTDLNQWLMAAAFASIEHRLRTRLSVQSSVRLMLTAHARCILRFPWRLWHLFEDYPQAELALCLPTYSRAPKIPCSSSGEHVCILAVLGNAQGIDLETDRQLLNRLPRSEVTLLVQPTLKELQHQLWESRWDILFFAGHSNSGENGYLQVNPTESLTIDQLRHALGRAIQQGLQLAILNSCDGLELAWALADLQLPQTIVMREPVPDAIAHEFLKGFLTHFARGQSLYTSVRDAREKLHAITRLGRCATWLPIIVQNPAEEPPTLQQLIGQSPGQPLSNPGSGWRQPKGSALGSALIITAILIGLRWLGGLQAAELWVYDALMRHRPTEGPDPRLVVVAIDERDLQAQAATERRGSLADTTLQQALSILADYDPRMIGIDLYRDFPASDAVLATALSQPNIVGVCKSRDAIADQVGISPPPELQPEQIGFSDFLEDSDGILRRQLVTLTPDPVSPCTTPYGFATLMAIHYLRQDGIQPTFTTQGHLQLGDVVFPRLAKRTGGLQQMDNGGNQLLLHYRAIAKPDQIATTVSLQQLLNGQVNPDRVRDRIVLIGVTASSSGDYWATPYGTQIQARTAGVFIQAQMISQLISAVEDDRPLVWVWPQWAEAMCIALGAIAGSLLAWRWKSSQLALAWFVTSGSLAIAAWAILLSGGWLPLLPIILSASSSMVLITTHRSSKNK